MPAKRKTKERLIEALSKIQCAIAAAQKAAEESIIVIEDIVLGGPQKRPGQAAKVIALPGIAERRRRRLNVEIAESAATVAEAEDGSTIEARLAGLTLSPKVETLSDTDLIGELSRRFESPGGDGRLRDLLSRAAENASAQRKAALAALSQAELIAHFFDQKQESTAFAMGHEEGLAFLREKKALKRGIRQAAQRGRRNLSRIKDRYLIGEIQRWACPSNDLSEIFAIIKTSIGMGCVVDARGGRRRA